MTRLMLVLPVLALAACAPLPPPPGALPAEPDPDACKASTYQGLVGQRRSVLDTMMLPAGTRVIGPGDPVTMDFRAERLNVEIGEGGRIERIACY